MEKDNGGKKAQKKCRFLLLGKRNRAKKKREREREKGKAQGKMAKEVITRFLLGSRFSKTVEKKTSAGRLGRDGNNLLTQ